MDKAMGKLKKKAGKKEIQTQSEDASTSSAPTLPIRTDKSKRLRREGSAVSVASRDAAAKRARMRPKVSRTSSNVSVTYLQVPTADDNAITSGDETNDSVLGDTSIAKIARPDELHEDTSLTHKPAWAVRHRIYLDNVQLSCTTTTRRPGLHNFGDVLLREQIETRLSTGHDGREAHFATRHAILRFWKADGSLAEKWIDKDFADEEREHEFAMENLNDWTILQLAMGAEEQKADEAEDDDGSSEAGEGDTSMEDNSEHVIVEDTDADQNENSHQPVQEHDTDQEDSTISPTMDITSHYLSSYYDARRIAAAPTQSAIDSGSESAEEDINDDGASVTGNFHWVEERRRNLENQLQTQYTCTHPSCSNHGGTCLSLSTPLLQSSQQPQRTSIFTKIRGPSSSSPASSATDSQAPPHHLTITPKDLTDWSQQIAHANRSIAATTLHLAAKLIDDETRDEDRRLAEAMREREDEDDLGAAVGRMGVLGILKPT